MFGLIAEAARLCGWLHLDADRGGLAQAFYVTALRTIYHARSAQTHLHSGDLDLACRDLTTAAGLVKQTSSVRSITTIREARRAMSVYADEPVVREFDGTLAHAVGTAA